jgi:RNA polymerase sigma-70 factor (ECF subfamily)
MTSSYEDEQSLLGRAREGDREALGELLEGSRERLRAVVRSRLGASLEATVDVDDVIQEVFFRAGRKLESFRWEGDASFVRWLAGIAVRVVQETASTVRRRPTARLPDDIPGSSPSPSRVLRREERLERLETVLRGLPPEYREVLRLVRVEGLKIRDVALQMGRSPHAVSNLLLRATRKLKERLDDTESLGLPDRGLLEGEGEDHDAVG